MKRARANEFDRASASGTACSQMATWHIGKHPGSTVRLEIVLGMQLPLRSKQQLCIKTCKYKVNKEREHSTKSVKVSSIRCHDVLKR